MTTEKEIKALEQPQQDSPEEAVSSPADKPPAKKRSPRKKKPKQQSYDHLPIIIALLVIFSFTLFGIGIGLTRYLSPERAGIPACRQVPCSPPFPAASSQKDGGE